jgi:hypothetical protein
MKTLKTLLLALVFSLPSLLHSQVSVNVNIGSPPQWGPAGYNNVRYYYIPDVEAYYDIHTAMFIYYGGGVWLQRSYLPAHHRHYDLYTGYKVVMTDYRGETPYLTFKNYKVKYKKGYKGPAQKTIGQRKASKPQSKSSDQSQKTKQQKKSGGNNSQGGGKGHK